MEDGDDVPVDERYFLRDYAERWLKDFENGIRLKLERERQADVDADAHMYTHTQMQRQTRKRRRQRETDGEESEGEDDESQHVSSEAQPSSAATSSSSSSSSSSSPASSTFSILPAPMTSLRQGVILAHLVDSILFRFADALVKTAELLNVQAAALVKPQFYYCLLHCHQADPAVAVLFKQLLPVSIEFIKFGSDEANVHAVTGSVTGNIGDGIEPSEEDIKVLTTPITHHDILRRLFIRPLQRQAELNQSSWYMNEAKVRHYAELFARGEVHESALMAQLRAAGIRPLLFYGTIIPGQTVRFFQATASTTLDHATNLPPCVHHASESASSSRSSVAYVMIEHTSAMDEVALDDERDWKLEPHSHLVCYVHQHHSDRGRVRLMDGMAQGPDCQLTADALDTVTRFSLVGPTLYTHNHPSHVSRTFASMFIDESSQLSHLPMLPTVLLDIIVEYARIDLPFIEHDARQQLASWSYASAHMHAHPSPSPSSSSSYPGQTLNPVESPVHVKFCLCREDENATNTATAAAEATRPKTRFMSGTQ